MTISRRMFVGSSAAALGAVVAVPGTAGASSRDDDTPPSPEEAAALGAPFLVQAVDPENARFEILIGEKSVAFTDHTLARTLSRLARGGRR